MRRVVTIVLSVSKYIIAVFMMHAGIATVFTREDLAAEPDFIYESRGVLVTIGVLFFTSGLTLFMGKLTKMSRIIGHGLFMVYSCFLFASLLSWFSFGFVHALGNLTATLVVGGLYLRWKYHIYYYDPVDKPHKLRYSSTTTE